MSLQSIHTEQFLPLLEQKLREGGSVTITVTGDSMAPFLIGGRDRVTLCPIDRPLRKNDLPLYRRGDGRLILHRVIRLARDGSLVCCGDHQCTPERVEPEQMLALAKGFTRKGRAFSDSSLPYRLACALWTALFPLRGRLLVLAARRSGRKD